MTTAHRGPTHRARARRTGNPFVSISAATFAALTGLTGLGVMTPRPACAQYFWTGSGANTNFSTAANWAGGVVPPSSPATSLVFGVSRSYAPVVDAGVGSPFTLGSLVFNPASGTYSLSGAVPLNFAGVGGSTLTQNAATNNTISNAIQLSTALTINGSGVGNLTLSGIISGNIVGTPALTIDQTGQLPLTSGTAINAFNAESGPGTGGSLITLSGANTFTGDVVLKNGNLVLGNASALGSASTNRLLVQAGSSTLRATGTVANNIVVDSGAALTYAGQTATLSGVISGAGGLNVYGQSVGVTPGLTLTGANTYTGATTIGYGTPAANAATTANLTLSGASGSLTGTSQINLLNNATLTLSNTLAYNANRINDAAGIFMTGGRILYTGQGTSSLATASKETFGALTLNGGYSAITFTNTNNQLTFAKLNAPIDKGTLFIRGSSVGGAPSTTTNNIYFTDSSGVTPIFVPGTSGTGIYSGVLPFIVGTNDTTTFPADAATFATYDANGVNLPASTNASYFAQISGSTLTADANNAVNSSAITINGSQRVNSLITNVVTTLSGTGTLQVYSGAFLPYDTLSITGPTIDFGNNTGYFHLGFRTSVNGASQIIGSNGVAVDSLDTGAGYTLTFNNAGGNPFTGGLFVNGNATVAFSADNQLGASGGGITLNGGALSYTDTAGASLGAARTLKVGTVAGSPGTINVGAGTTLTVPSTIAGAGDLIKTGTGTLALTGTNTNTGSLIATAGTLQFNGQSALPAGGIISQGATLNPTQTMTLTGPITLVSAPGTTTVGTTTFNINAGQTLTLAGTLKGAPANAALSKTGAGTLEIASNADFGGATTVSAGSLNLTGSLRNASSLTAATGGTINLNYAATGAATDKLGDQTGVTLNGGEVVLTGATSGQTVENFGLLTAGTGGSSIFTLIPGASGSLIATATLGYSGTGSVLFRGNNLGGTTGSYSQLFLTGQATGFITNTLADTSATGTGLTQAYYDPTVGIRAARDTDYNEYSVIQDVPNSGPVPITANVLIGGSFTNVTTGGSTNAYNTVNSLAFRNNGTLTLAAGTPTLYLQSGGIFLSEGSNATITSGSIGGGVNGTATKTISVGGNGNLTLASNLTTSGGLSKSGNGTLTLTNAKTFTGGTTLSGGTLQFATDNALTGTGTVTTTAGTTLNLNNTNQSLSALTGAGNVVLTSGKTLTLTGASTVGGVISGGGGIAFSPATATLTLNGANTYSGGTSVGPTGSVTLGNVNGFGTGAVTFSNTTATSTVTFNTGSGTVANDLNLSTVSTGSPNITFTNGTNANQNVTLSGKISGGVAARIVRFNGPLANTSGFNLTNANNDFLGTIEIFQGNVGITSNAALGNAANSISLNAVGTIPSGLVLNAQNIDVARSIVATSTSAINTNANNGTVSGILSGTAGLSKLGVGTLTLSNTANTYSGALTVSEGTLNLTGNFTAATKPTITIATGASLTGTASSAGGGGSVVLGATGFSGSTPNGVLSPGNGGVGAFGTLNLQTLTINNGSVLQFDLNLSSGTSDSLVIAGVLNKGATTDTFFIDLNPTGTLSGVQTYTLATFGSNGPTNPVSLADITLRGVSGYTSQLAFDTSARNLLLTLSASAQATPEPSSLAFVLLVVPAASGVWRIRVKKARKAV